MKLLRSFVRMKTGRDETYRPSYTQEWANLEKHMSQIHRQQAIPKQKQDEDSVVEFLDKSFQDVRYFWNDSWRQ